MNTAFYCKVHNKVFFKIETLEAHVTNCKINTIWYAGERLNTKWWTKK